jgi:prepilin-type processing-associated H-X9-DG protein
MKRIRNLLLLLIVLLSLGWLVYQARAVAQARIDQTVSVRQLSDLSAAAMAYAAAHGNRFPTTLAVLLAASPRLPPGMAISPLASDKTAPSYEMVAPAQALQQISNPAHTPMMRSVFTTQDGKRIVAFCDGHIEIVSE